MMRKEQQIMDSLQKVGVKTEENTREGQGNRGPLTHGWNEETESPLFYIRQAMNLFLFHIDPWGLWLQSQGENFINEFMPAWRRQELQRILG